MCGIVGFTGNPENKEQIIRAMADAIAHRGPDGEGYFCEDGVALGHRRLSIIDLEGGAQPLFNEDGSLALVFNGEIYNFMELREELLAKGHTFTTRSDSEVLLHGFEEWGTALPEKLRTVIHLYYYEGYTLEEIASLLGVTVSAVKMRMKRGRDALRNRLEGAE